MNLTRKLLLTFLFVSSSASAQLFSFGVKAGVPLTDPFPTSTNAAAGVVTRAFSDSKGFLVGPMAEVRIPVVGISVEADALYRPMDLVTQTAGGVRVSRSNGSWEFPIVAKYRLGFPVVKPYVEAGASFRKLGGNLDSYLSQAGLTLGGGVEVKLLKLRVAPELRYTHWGDDKNPPQGIGFLAPSGTNQVEFLVGFSF